VASEERARTYRGVMDGKGLRVSESKGRQRTLLGGEVEYHTVTGIREGSYRVTVTLAPGPERVQVVVQASSSEAAERAARRLRELGFRVEIDEEVVRGTARNPTASKISKAIDIAEEATKK